MATGRPTVLTGSVYGPTAHVEPLETSDVAFAVSREPLAAWKGVEVIVTFQPVFPFAPLSVWVTRRTIVETPVWSVPLRVSPKLGLAWVATEKVAGAEAGAAASSATAPAKAGIGARESHMEDGGGT